MSSWKNSNKLGYTRAMTSDENDEKLSWETVQESFSENDFKVDNKKKFQRISASPLSEMFKKQASKEEVPLKKPEQDEKKGNPEKLEQVPSFDPENIEKKVKTENLERKERPLISENDDETGEKGAFMGSVVKQSSFSSFFSSKRKNSTPAIVKETPTNSTSQEGERKKVFGLFKSKTPHSQSLIEEVETSY